MLALDQPRIAKRKRAQGSPCPALLAQRADSLMAAWPEMREVRVSARQVLGNSALAGAASGPQFTQHNFVSATAPARHLKKPEADAVSAVVRHALSV
jgi:hypothetical protein